MSEDLDLEKTKFPTPDYLDSIISKLGDWDCIQYLAGEKIIIEGIEPKGFEIVETAILKNQPEPEDENNDEDEDNDDDEDAEEDDPDAIKATMKLRVGLKTKEEKIKEMFSEIGISVKEYKIVSSDSFHHDVEALVLLDYCETKVIESPFLDMFWKKRMNAVITEGVCYSKSKVPDDLRDSLRTLDFE